MRLRVTLLLVGAALAAAGVALVATAAGPGLAPRDLGWIAWTPLEDPDLSIWRSEVWVVARQAVLGSALCAFGAALLAGVAGFLLGQRRGRRSRAQG